MKRRCPDLGRRFPRTSSEVPAAPVRITRTVSQHRAAYAGHSAVAAGVVENALRLFGGDAKPGAVGLKTLPNLSNEFLHPL